MEVGTWIWASQWVLQYAVDAFERRNGRIRAVY
jgi:hypothetical protein